ncbi:NUDIX hydrolase [Arcticibacterium luteifluviistationis]|uniref:NUDIX hydrolase n=1 Tax=Arcticibacterium luteifluviistationis TaxID=1784714 RepID=A0A2Z4GHP9_9BACT|nr:NUDIX domain-containing protein [Arcticibacterium luteifluviistationis]AWW00871.1 NUDIX hydrolase [Arcticibacterium luteifluviistationis]
MKLFKAEEYIDQLSIDSVIFGYKNKELKVLVAKVHFEGDFWSLPGGFIYKEEGTDLAAARILEERTGLRDIFLEQYRVFGQEGRSNNVLFENLLNVPKSDFFTKEDFKWLSQRFVSIAYYALVEIDRVKLSKGVFDEKVEWVDYKKLPNLIMDHSLMVEHALETLRLNFDRKLIGFNLLPETFTMRELKELYEAVYDKPFARNNFQKKMLDLNVLERLEKKYTGAANKAPYLYRFKH